MPVYSRVKRLRPLVWAKTSGKCYYCGTSLTLPFASDHVEPLSKGGKTELENLVPTCQSCNSKKGNKTLDQFRRWNVAPAFTENQILFLMETGAWVSISEEIKSRVDRFKFWFETQDSNA